jgi:hypothetical protein
MSKTRGQGITPPPPLGEDENASIVETSTTPIVKELMKTIEKLKSKLSKLKAYDMNGKNNGSASDDDDSS